MPSAVDVTIVLAMPSYAPNAAQLERALDPALAAGAELIVASYGAGTEFATFGAAANAGARASQRALLVFLNAAQPLMPNWLQPLVDALALPGAGAAGPRIVTSDGTGDICGYMVCSAPYTFRGFAWHKISNLPAVMAFDAVPDDCIAATRATFERAGGFAETFGAELEGLDFCFRVTALGLRVLIEPNVAVARQAPKLDVRDLAQQPVRERSFTECWRDRVILHDNFWPELLGSLGRADFYETGIALERAPLPKIGVIVHGDAPPSPEFAERLWQSRLAPSEVLWAATAPAPPRVQVIGDAVAAARDLTEVRGQDLVAFVRTDTLLAPDWLNDLVNVIGRAPEIAAATIDGSADPLQLPDRADARCTLVALRVIPQHLRIGTAPDLDASVATWLHAVTGAGRTIARVSGTKTTVASGGERIETATVAERAPDDVFASIVMLSWNAPEYTERAVESIRERTRLPHEIIIVDNGSGPETVARVERIPGIRVIYNAVNTGFAYGCSQGMAAARGTHVVLLNNDVIVTDGWLEALIDVQRKNPAVGCSAPRTNLIAGAQQIDDVPYRDLADLPAFAAARAREQRGGFSHQARVIGFCMCLPRRVIDEIGALDPRYGTGNFEDDDYCMRIRAAGYDIVVCEDSFIHHFGSVSFSTNKVDHRSTIVRNREIFGKRWNVPFTDTAYDARLAFGRGFVRARDYVPLPPATAVGPDWVRPS